MSGVSTEYISETLGHSNLKVTRVLNQAVKRNITRFPDDFMFILTVDEWEFIRSQNVTALQSKRNISAAPYAFTEQGLAMLSGILNSEKAIAVNIAIMRAFVMIRQFALSNKELTAKLKELETAYNKRFKDVYDTIINYLLKKDKSAKRNGNKLVIKKAISNSRLRFKDIDGDLLTYNRQKTKGKKKGELDPIRVHLRPEAKQIITRWGNKQHKVDNYIFPILTAGITPKQELATIKQFTKTINKYIKRIAKSVGIEKEITTYTARHSYATVLKRAGVSTEYISETLGHSNLKVTESYLDSFESDELAKNSDFLV